MNKTILNIIGLFVIFVGLLISLFLFIFKNISEFRFASIVVLSSAVGFLIYKIDEIVEFKTSWIELKTIRKEVYAKAEEVKELSEELNKDKEELREATRVFVESFYLTLQTRNIFPIPDKIAHEIEKNLNILASFSVNDEKKRNQWVSNIHNLLNSK